MAIQYNENYNGAMPFSDVCWQIMITGAGATDTVPGLITDNYLVIFRYNCTSNVYVGYNVEPFLPIEDNVLEQPYVAFKPERKFVHGGDVLNFITDVEDSIFLGAEFYKLP